MPSSRTKLWQWLLCVFYKCYVLCGSYLITSAKSTFPHFAQTSGIKGARPSSRILPLFRTRCHSLSSKVKRRTRFGVWWTQVNVTQWMKHLSAGSMQCLERIAGIRMAVYFTFAGGSLGWDWLPRICPKSTGRMSWHRICWDYCSISINSDVTGHSGSKFPKHFGSHRSRRGRPQGFRTRSQKAKKSIFSCLALLLKRLDSKLLDVLLRRNGSE